MLFSDSSLLILLLNGIFLSLAKIAMIKPGKPAPDPKSIRLLVFLSIKSITCELSKKCLVHISLIVDFPIKFSVLLDLIR